MRLHTRHPTNMDRKLAWKRNLPSVLILSRCSFEYNGRTYSLNSPAEIAAWIRERKSLFPTAARVQQKRQEEEDQRVADDRVRLAAREADLKARKSNFTDDPDENPLHRRRKIDINRKFKTRAGRGRLDTTGGSPTAKRLARLDGPDPDPTRSISHPNLGINYASDTSGEQSAHEGDSDVLSVVSSSSAISSESESESSSSDNTDDDGPPAEEPIKPVQPIRVLPPTRQNRRNEPSESICRDFRRFGSCPRGKGCKYKHSEKKLKKNLYQQVLCVPPRHWQS
jgi:hypothetical protein